METLSGESGLNVLRSPSSNVWQSLTNESDQSTQSLLEPHDRSKGYYVAGGLGKGGSGP